MKLYHMMNHNDWTRCVFNTSSSCYTYSMVQCAECRRGSLRKRTPMQTLFACSYYYFLFCLPLVQPLMAFHFFSHFFSSSFPIHFFPSVVTFPLAFVLSFCLSCLWLCPSFVLCHLSCHHISHFGVFPFLSSDGPVLPFSSPLLHIFLIVLSFQIACPIFI